MTNKSFVAVLFAMSLLASMMLWWSLSLSTLIFGVDTQGEITNITVSKVKTLREHITVDFHIQFQTLEGQKLKEVYSGDDDKLFSEGPIKVRYNPSSPTNYIFSTLGSSYLKFYFVDDGPIIASFVFLAIALIGMFGGLKALGIDLWRKLMARKQTGQSN